MTDLVFSLEVVRTLTHVKKNELLNPKLRINDLLCITEKLLEMVMRGFGVSALTSVIVGVQKQEVTK